jgi:hypothetical protein
MLHTWLASLTLLMPAQASAPAGATLDAGYRHMYNLEFNDAHRIFQEWERVHPSDAMGPVSDAAAYLFGEFERLHILQSEFFTHDESFANKERVTPSNAARSHFEAALETGRQLASRALSRDPNDVNARFAEILRMGLHADYLALINKSYLTALNEMKTGRVLAEKLIASHPELKDAYLAVGVENYMLSLRPAPVRWVLRMAGAQTDKEQGIQQLKLTAEGGRYLQPYARLLLAVAALRDKNVNAARTLLADLAKEFPHNPLYAQELARLP